MLRFAKRIWVLLVILLVVVIAVFVVDRFPSPKVRHRQEAVDLSIKHQARLVQAVKEVLADAGPPHGTWLALDLA